METANETVVAAVPVPGASEEQALTTEVTGLQVFAEGFIVETDDDYQKACEFGRELKRKESEVTEFFKPMKDAAHQAHKAVCDREKAMLQPLKNAERVLKESVGLFLTERERKRKAAEEAARRAAEEERERKLREAIEAEAAGDNEAAADAMTEAMIMDQASATITVETGNPAKAAGTAVRKDWRIKSVDPKAVPVEICGIELRPVDNAAVMRLIRMSKGNVSIPGIEFEEVNTMSFRR